MSNCATLDIPYPAYDGTQPCVSEDPELFFPRSESSGMDLEIARAISLCQTCPFQRPCLAYAIAVDVHGIWGGVNRAERVRLRQELGIRAVSPRLSDNDHLHDEIDAMERGGGLPPERSRRGWECTRTPSTATEPTVTGRTSQHDH